MDMVLSIWGAEINTVALAVGSLSFGCAAAILTAVVQGTKKWERRKMIKKRLSHLTQ
ncbi:hypothetical protein ACP3V3_19670 [Vibrio sp. PNB22_3_1]